MAAIWRQFSFKCFGNFRFNNDFEEVAEGTGNDLNEFIKVLFVRKGGEVTIDFSDYTLEQDAFFFINAGEYFKISEHSSGVLLYYNRDFYCVEIHDHEVACDGILFHNVYETPVVWMDDATSGWAQDILSQITEELEASDSNSEEMIRTLLKQIIIKCTRLWKSKHQLDGSDAVPEAEFLRSFSRLVDANFTKLHTVGEYADLLNITAKGLNKRITRYNSTTPNDIIKNRIILEAKRLLVHTDLSIKEIAYKLGYDDASYFIRFFTKQTTFPPQGFRNGYQQGLMIS